MHETAKLNCKAFFETYSSFLSSDEAISVVEIGSQDVNGGLRGITPSHFKYIGVDFQQARGVDIVLQDPYVLPFDSASTDIVISSSCFEHSEMFWLVFLEVMRVLKPHGLFYLNAPSTGSYHRYPLDCWRFYPDSGNALVTWSRRNGYTTQLLESYIQRGGEFQDFVAVFIKEESLTSKYPERILHKKKDFINGQVLGESEVRNKKIRSQNDLKLQAIGKIVSEEIRVN